MRVPIDDLILFFRQLGEMLRCGVPLVPALDVFARDERNRLAPLALGIASKVESGRSLSVALEQAECHIPATIIVLVQIGERTGRIAESLLQATDWLKEDRALVKKVWGSLTYPLLVLTVSCLLALCLFTTVVPKLIDVMVGLGADLPWPTKLVASISSTLCEPSFWLILASLACLAAYELTIPECRRSLARTLVEMATPMPLLGSTLQAYFFVRFCKGLGVLLENGVSVLQAASLAQKLSGHPGLLADEKDFRKRIEEGQSLAAAMESRPDLYPSIVVSFVMLGEESASLAMSVQRSGEIQNQILQNRLEAFRQALEPILTVGVGALVALVLVATMLPLYSIVASF